MLAAHILHVMCTQHTFQLKIQLQKQCKQP